MSPNIKMGSTAETSERGKQLHEKVLKGKLMNPNSSTGGGSEGQGALGLLHAALQGEGGSASTATHSQGDCLTKPSTPYANKGLDNVEGNLIVHKKDLIRIPNQKVHRHESRTKLPNFNQGNQLGMTSFEILDLLGQGTFAQVFKCRNIETGELCAVKIVKNKPEYTRQVQVEIRVFQSLSRDAPGQFNGSANEDSTVQLLCYFIHESHPCLVFELLGQNLFELLKRRQFRGLPLKAVREVVKETMEGMIKLSQRKIVHCDLKPENILIVSEEVTEAMTNDEVNNIASGTKKRDKEKKIKLIDFGSACFEGNIAYTYTQSRYYRSPEVLVGIDYDSAIDMWSLGCVAVELFLGLPILPGVHEHDQLSRICAMIGSPPDWMLDKGKNTLKYFSKATDIKKNTLQEQSSQVAPRRRKIFHQTINEFSDDLSTGTGTSSERPVQSTKYEIKSREKFVKSLTDKDKERERNRGLTELEQKPDYTYVVTTSIESVVMDRGSRSNCDQDTLRLFIHFLEGILTPDPCERWTAFQASSHPFITGKKTPTRMNTTGIRWTPPFDRTIGLRKLDLKLSLKSERETNPPISEQGSDFYASPAGDMTNNSSWIGQDSYQHGGYSPPSSIGGPSVLGMPPPNLDMPVQYMSGSIGAIPYQSGGVTASQYAHPSSLSHLNSQVEPGDIPFSQVPIAPQSFNVIYYDGMNHISTRGDLGMALQRPGIVPDGPVMNHMQQPNMNPAYFQPSQQHLTGQSLNMGQYSGNSHIPIGHFSPSYLSMPMSSHLHGSSMPASAAQHQTQFPQGVSYNQQNQDRENLILQDEHDYLYEENTETSARPSWSYYRGASM